MFSRHNEKRALHQNTPPMTLDASFCAQAQQEIFSLQIYVQELGLWTCRDFSAMLTQS